MEQLEASDPAQVGPYRIVARLGQGGMGRVFLGRSPGGRLLAIKVIRDNLAEDPGFRERFRREVAVARSVSGLFTAPVVDADLDAQLPWLATAYVAGPSLADAVNRYGPLPPDSVLGLMAGLAEGLAAIHAADVVHRDLKPANVLLAEDGPRVIDFGISRAGETAALTHTGLVIGSPGFMSPEQAEGGSIRAASDVFSLGSVLVFAATGEGPFGRGPTAALVYRVVHAQPALDGVPAAVRGLLVRCLAKDPAARPAPAELLAALGEQGRTGVVEGWLPEPMMAGYRERAAALTQPPRAAAAGSAPPGSAPPGSAPPGSAPPGGTNGDGAIPSLPRPRASEVRRRQRRTVLALAGAALIVAASASAVAMAKVNGASAGTKGQRLSAAGAPSGLAASPVLSGAGPRAPAAGGRTTAPRTTAPRTTAPRTTGPGVVTPNTDPGTTLPGTTEPPATMPAQPEAVRPATPVNILATAEGRYSIEVSWADSAAGGTGFRIDNGCPAGACGGGGSTLAQTVGNVRAAVFAVTPGTYQCFRVRAFNSRGTSRWSGYGCASTPGLVLPGARRWTGTGVEVQAGDRLGLTASGVVNIADAYPAFPAGPGGDPSCVPARDYPIALFPAPELSCWSLIARIGNGAPFEVGTSTLVVPGYGELYLGINAGRVAGDSGSWTVNIKFGTLPPRP